MATVDVTKIHQGPGNLWVKVLRPVTGKRLLIDANGNPIQPTGLASVAVSTAYAQWAMVKDPAANTQIALVGGTSAATAPSYASVAGETTVDGTVIWMCCGTAGGIYGGSVEGATTVGTGPKLTDIAADQITAPIDVVMTGEEGSIEVDMLETDLAKLSAIIAHGSYATGTDAGLPSGEQVYEEIHFGGLIQVPRFAVAVVSPRRNAASKFVVSELYQAYQAQVASVAFSKEKASTVKVKFMGLADPTRVAGDQVGKIYRQM